MQVGSIFGNIGFGQKAVSSVVDSSANVASFEDILKNAISEVNDKQVEAYDSMKDIASGKVTNLQEAVMKIDEAELSLKLGLEVKNKAISAYKEIMRMQI